MLDGIRVPCTEVGRRSQPRVQGVLPVRISGTDRDGHHFSEHVCTMEISAKGTRLAGVRALLSVGDTLRIGYHNRTARFRIKWTALASSAPRETHVGVECLDPDKGLWPIRLPVEGDDHYEGSEVYKHGRCNSGGRRHARFVVSGTASVCKFGGVLGYLAKVGDISLSGCYLQTSEPLNVGLRATLLIKVADTQIEANGVVRFTDSTLGMGIGFTYMSAADRRKLTRLIAQLEHANAVTDKEIDLGSGLKASAAPIKRGS
jgi:hypothetical protein